MHVSSPKPKEYQLTYESAPMIAKALERAKARGDDPETYEPDPDEMFDDAEFDTIEDAEREVKRLKRAGILAGHAYLTQRVNIRDEGFTEDGHYFECWAYDYGDIVRDAM